MSNPAVVEVEATSIDLLRKEIAPVLQRAKTLVVRNAAERAEVKAFVVAVKQAQDQVHKKFDAMVDKSHKAWKEALALRASFLDPLEQGEKAGKRVISTYDEEQERLRLEEQRRLQAIASEAATRERMKAEQEAAKQREIQRQAAERAAESRRKAEEADATERKRLLAEAEAAERKAAAAAVKVEAKEEQAAAVPEPVVTVSGPEKQKGESTKKLWRARLTDKKAVIKAAAEGNEIAALCLSFDQATANRQAGIVKGAVSVPGIDWYEQPSLAIKAE